jgi:hypothetical protein
MAETQYAAAVTTTEEGRNGGRSGNGRVLQEVR